METEIISDNGKYRYFSVVAKLLNIFSLRKNVLVCALVRILKKMGKRKITDIRSFFDYDDQTDLSKCTIANCGTLIKGDHSGNLSKHLKNVHVEIFERIINDREQNKKGISFFQIYKNCKQIIFPFTIVRQTMPCQSKITDFLQSKKISIETNIVSLKRALVRMVTVDGRPFCAIHDVWFKNLILPMATQLNLTIDDLSLRMFVNEEYTIIKNLLIEEMNEKLIAIKVDCASRFNRHVIGINAQFYSNGEILVKTLAIRELFESCTSDYLITILKDVLKDFKIPLSRVFCITTDNGSNMIKAVKLMQEDINWPLEVIDVDQVPIIDEVEDDNFEEDIENEIFDHGDLYDMSVLALTEEHSNILRGIRCAAHTLQLSIRDFLTSVDAVLQEARILAKKLRKPLNIRILKRLKKRLPIIDCPTRWGSTYHMIVRLLDYQDCVSDMSVEPTTKFWSEITDLIESLKPVEILNTQLQKGNLLPGDFYMKWIKCKLELSNSTAKHSNALLMAIKTREYNVLNSDVLLSAIFLDPRFKRLLSVSETLQAKVYIKTVMEQISRNIDMTNTEPKCVELSSEDEFEKLLSSKDESSSNYVEIDRMLNLYESEPRVEKNENILNYWSKYTNETLRKIALFLMATPVTQVSVERAFSALHYICNEQRTRMKTENLNKLEKLTIL